MVKEASKKVNGFSFLELVISMTILTVVALTLFPAMSYGKKQQLQSNENMMAMAVLEKEMNLLRSTGAKNLAIGTTTRTTTKDQDGLVGTLTTQVTAGGVPEEKFVRTNLTWAGRSESVTGFLYQE